MGALLLLLLDRLALQDLLLPALFLEARIAAGPQGQPSPVEMQDMVGDVVEQVAVMADDEDRGRLALQVVGQPQHAFEVEIVGRLVEQQNVGRGEQHRRERDAHAPAAGELRQGTILRGFVEAEAGEDARRPRRRGMGVDVGEPYLDFGDPLRVGRALGLFQQGARSTSASKTKSINDCGPPGASCSTLPRLAPLGTRIEPPSGEISPRIRRKSVDLPAPFRPTTPTRAPVGSATVALSMRSRSPRR